MAVDSQKHLHTEYANEQNQYNALPRNRTIDSSNEPEIGIIITIRLSAPMIRALSEVSVACGKTRSEVMRSIIIEWLEGNGYGFTQR